MVTFIPKIGKKDYTSPKSFIPICLTSFMLKTLEKTVDNYIRAQILNSQPLHPGQHAYRAGRSTETALYQLTSTIQGALDNKETVLCAFLDIEGAFDNTSHEAVRRALEAKRVERTLTCWIQHMLTTRTAETMVGNSTIQLQTTRGCPQGGVLSPLLWSLVVDELLHTLTNHGISCQGYADDIVIIARGKFEGTLCDIIQRGLHITLRWSNLVGLNINPSKTTIVPFTRRRKLDQLRQITLNGSVLDFHQEVKYLGITLDSKLLWRSHLEYIKSKATKALMVCRSFAGKSWGALRLYCGGCTL